MRLENEQIREPEPNRQRKLVLHKETLKNLKANGFSKNVIPDHPTSECDSQPDCCETIKM